MQTLNVPFQNCCLIIVLHKLQILFKFNCSPSSTHQHSPPLSLPQISFPKICTSRFFKVQLKHNFWQKFFPSTPIGNIPFFPCILYSPSKMCNNWIALIIFSQKGLLQSLLRSIPICELFSFSHSPSNFDWHIISIHLPICRQTFMELQKQFISLH